MNECMKCRDPQKFDHSFVDWMVVVMAVPLALLMIWQHDEFYPFSHFSLVIPPALLYLLRIPIMGNVFWIGITRDRAVHIHEKKHVPIPTNILIEVRTGLWRKCHIHGGTVDAHQWKLTVNSSLVMTATDWFGKSISFDLCTGEYKGADLPPKSILNEDGLLRMLDLLQSHESVKSIVLAAHEGLAAKQRRLQEATH